MIVVDENLYLMQHFQKKLETSLKLYKKQAKEEKPYEYKYAARDIQLALLSELPNQTFSQLTSKIVCEMILNYHLGINFSETEEVSASEKYFKQSITKFSELDLEVSQNFMIYLFDLYNNMGLLLVNKEEVEKGVSVLNQGKELYERLKSSNIFQGKFIINDFNEFAISNEKQKQFQYFFEGGMNESKIESLYTHNLFYLAQAFGKLGLKDQSAQYCGETMQRQYETNTHQVKDWAVNCLNLAEYYMGIRNFSQSLYILLCGQAIIPQNKRKKLKASFCITLGNLLQQQLDTSIKIKQNLVQEDLQRLLEVFNKKSLQFNKINIQFPSTSLAKSTEELQSLFRQASTQYKRACETYILDGYVTEYVEIQHHLSKLYKTLALIESPTRSIALHEKRLTFLEPLMEQINPKAFQALWEKILVVCAEIHHELFQMKLIYSVKEDPNDKSQKQKEKVEGLNKNGHKTVEYYEKIYVLLIEDKEIPRDQSYYQSIINAKFNCAKTLSKMIFYRNDEKIQYQKKSLDYYNWIINYLEKDIKVLPLAKEFDQEKSLCYEMIDLIQIKLDKIAHSQ